MTLFYGFCAKWTPCYGSLQSTLVKQSYWAMEYPKLQVRNWSHFERGGRLDGHLRFLLLHCFYWFFYNPIKIVIIQTSVRGEAETARQEWQSRIKIAKGKKVSYHSSTAWAVTKENKWLFGFFALETYRRKQEKTWKRKKLT